MKWTQISIPEAEQMLESQEILLLDMRDYHHYLADHHPRALHLSSNNLRNLLKHADRTVPVLIYCYHGHSSQDMAQLFADFGFISCYSLEGGYDAWFQHMARPNADLSKELDLWLLEHGFDDENLDMHQSNNDTALMVCSREGKIGFALELIDKGASTHLCNQDGNNSLWMAVQSGSLELVQTLIQAGTPINQQNDHGATPLMLAMSLNLVSIVTLLLDSGADWTLTTKDGFAAEDTAGSRRILNLFRSYLTQRRQVAA